MPPPRRVPPPRLGLTDRLSRFVHSPSPPAPPRARSGPREHNPRDFRTWRLSAVIRCATSPPRRRSRSLARAPPRPAAPPTALPLTSDAIPNVPARSGVPPLLPPVELDGNDASGSSSSSSNLTAAAAVSPAFATAEGAASGGTPAAPIEGTPEPPPTNADGVPQLGKAVWEELRLLQSKSGTLRGYDGNAKAFVGHCRAQGW